MHTTYHSTTNLAQTTELNRHETLSINQNKLITELTAAKKELRGKVSTMDQALQEKSADMVTLQGIYQSSKENLMVSEQTAANLREDIISLNKTIQEDEDALAKGWKKISSHNDIQSNSDRYEKLWKKSIASRKLEQESTQALIADLKAAEETIARLQSEAHNTSIELDDLQKLSPIGLSPPNKSPAMAFSDITQPPSVDHTGLAPSPIPAHSVGSAGIYEKEEMIQM